MAYRSPINKIVKFFPAIEGVCLAAFAVGYLLKVLHYSAGSEIIILTLSTLSTIYFLKGYIPPVPEEQDPNTRNQPLGFTALLGRTIAPKIMSIGSSVTVTGILFTILHWNGFREMLLIGSTSLGAASLLALITTMNDEHARKTNEPTLLRAVFLLLVGIYLLFIYGVSTPVV